MASISRSRRLALLLAAALAATAGAYALSGFVIAPFAVQTWLWPWLSGQLGGRFHAERTIVDPFHFSLALDGFTLDSPEGKPLASIAELTLEVDARASLKKLALVGKARVAKPSIHLALDPQGRPNFAFLLGKDDPAAPPARPFPFLLTELKIEQGALDFESQSKGKVYKKNLPAIDISVEQLSTAADAPPARFKIGISGENQERLSTEGELHLSKTALAGELKLESVELAALAGGLMADLPYTVDSGTLSLQLKYRYASDTAAEFSVAAAEIKQLKLSQDGRPFAEIPAIKADAFSFQQQANRFELQSLTLESPALKTQAPLSAQSLAAQGLSFQGKNGRVEVQSLAAAQLKLGDGAAPWGQAAAVAADGLAYTLDDGRLALAQLKLSQPALKTAAATGGADAIQLRGVAYQTKNEHLEAQALGIAQLQLDGLGAIGAAAAEGLAYSLADNGLALAKLNLSQAAWKTAAAAGSADTLQLQNLAFQSKTGRVDIQTLAAATLKLDQNAQPWAEVGTAAADGLAYLLASGKLDLQRLSLAQIELKTPTPIVGKDGKPRQHRLDSLAADGLALNPAKKTLQLGMLQTSGATLSAWLEADGRPGFPGLPKPRAEKTAARADAAGQPWQVRWERVELNDNNIVLRDFSQAPATGMYLSHLNLLLKTCDSASAKPCWVGVNTGLSANGRIALEGQVKLAPLTANLKLYVDDLSLPAFQSYIDQAVRVRVVKGKLNLNADIDYADSPEKKLRVGGDVAVADFASDDKQENRDFVNWANLRLSGLIFETAPQRLSIRDIDLAKPYIRAYFDAERKFNLVENLSPPRAAPPKPAPPRLEKPAAAGQAAPPNPAEEPLAVVIGTFNLRQGDAEFADLSIKPLGFAADIHDLNGNIRSLSSRADAKSDLLLQGRLNQGSAVKIYGKINPFSVLAYSDVAMRFEGVNLTTLTPYAAKFAGYRIEKGKLAMDLRYKLDRGQLTAENHFTLDQLQLGERIDSPTATTLPVSLAVALLKDADGKINLSLPISGDLSNPDISVGGLLGAAAGSLLQKVLAAPFNLLASLAGGSAEELEAVAFAPGAATLSQPEKEQLAAIAKVLKDRTALSLDIKGAADLELDRPALAAADLARQLKNAKLIEIGRRKSKSAEWDETTLSPQDYQRLLTNLYRWKNPAAAELQTLQPGDSFSGAALESAKRKLLDNWTVGEMDLRGLARARGESIRSFLVQEQGLPDQRIYLSAVKLGDPDAKGDKEIKARLSLSGS